MEEAEAAVREERARARDAENRAELAERAVMEERQRAQEAERRYVIFFRFYNITSIKKN